MSKQVTMIFPHEQVQIVSEREGGGEVEEERESAEWRRSRCAALHEQRMRSVTSPAGKLTTTATDSRVSKNVP